MMNLRSTRGVLVVASMVCLMAGLSCSDDKSTDPPPDGACCLPGGSCMIVTRAQCDERGGFWGGAASACLPDPCLNLKGACCRPEGRCTYVIEGECPTGDWRPGLPCDLNPCHDLRGACCLPDGTCGYVIEAWCPTGDWRHGVPCDPNPCPRPLGACCFSDGTCHYVLEADCPTNIWLMLQACDPSPCPQFGQMIWIPAGNVRMGKSEIAEPVDDVWVDGYWIGKYGVTNGEYAVFIAAGGYTTEAYWNPVGWDWRVSHNIRRPETWNSNQYHGGGIPGNEQFPVNSVSWWEADAYCRWAGLRLPTEAEWEKAAKGPSPHNPTYPFGERITGQVANYRDSGHPWGNNTTPVGFYDGRNYQGFQTIDSPSPYGLYDMTGNVWEWTSTRHAAYPYDPDDGREDPPATRNECCRVLRGGSWRSLTSALRCAFRNYDNPDSRPNVFGFRCVRD